MSELASGTWRDSHGVPHVRAGSAEELAFAQGRVTARDRAWQLEIERLRGEGRTAALLGENAAEWDVFARRALLADVARRAYDGLDVESGAFVAAYAAGVNSTFADGVTAPELERLGVTPGRWEPWTPLAVFLAQHVLFGTFPSKLWRERLHAVAGDAGDLFRTEGLPGGSNAVLVGPELTASGRPVVAGDPHRLFEAPNVYQQVRLACPEFDVLGYTFPGVPGVQHFAHAGEVAWAITNAVADYQDLYVESLERRGTEVWAAGPGGPEPVTRWTETVEVRDGDDVEVEVLATSRGPVVLGGPGERAWSLRTPSYVLGDLGFGAILPLLRARTVADVDAALEGWVEPVNSVLAADRAGGLLHRVAGRVPQRADGLSDVPGRGEDGDGWIGWVDPPRIPVSPDGVLATANDRGHATYDRIGRDFAAPFRADRIHELLAGRSGLTADEVVAVLADTRQNAGKVLLDVVGNLADLPPEAATARERLLAWDRTMACDDVGAATYAALRDRVVELLCAAEPLEQLAGAAPFGDLWQPWFALPTRVAACLHVILAADRPFGLGVADLVAQALADVAAADRVPAWGERHVFHPLHALEQFGLDHEPTAPATPLPGDSDAVFAAGFLPAADVCVRGPVARYVWDLDDRERSRWVVPLGASGLPDSPHHTDQHAAWAAGGTVPVTTRWDQLTEESP